MIGRLLLSVFCVVCLIGVVPPSLLAQENTQIAWNFAIKEDSNGNPAGKVYLKVGKKRVLILKDASWSFSEVDLKSEEAAGHDVPRKAVTACFGWWAGSGVDIYVIRKGKQLVVYARFLDEMVANSKFEKLKSIPLP
jgi:hypothetical protein